MRKKKKKRRLLKAAGALILASVLCFLGLVGFVVAREATFTGICVPRPLRSCI